MNLFNPCCLCNIYYGDNGSLRLCGSNAFMELCARFPVRRDATTGSCVASKEQSLLSKEMSRECPVETPDPYLTRALHPRAEGSAAGIDELQQKTAGAQDDSGQVITEVCVAETPTHS